jgi:hypothetical protein
MRAVPIKQILDLLSGHLSALALGYPAKDSVMDSLH